MTLRLKMIIQSFVTFLKQLLIQIPIYLFLAAVTHSNTMNNNVFINLDFIGYKLLNNENTNIDKQKSDNHSSSEANLNSSSPYDAGSIPS